MCKKQKSTLLPHIPTCGVQEDSSNIMKTVKATTLIQREHLLHYAGEKQLYVAFKNEKRKGKFLPGDL